MNLAVTPTPRSPVPQHLHPDRLRQVFGAWPSGVAVLAAIVDGDPLGITVNSFTSLSLDPALVALSLHKRSHAWNLLRDVPRLGISILARHQEHVGRRLAARVTDRFHGVDWSATENGAIMLDGVTAWLDVAVVHVVDAGDHDLAVLAVHDMDFDRAQAPLVFHASCFTQLAAK